LLPADAKLLSTESGRTEYIKQARKLGWKFEHAPNGVTIITTPWGKVTIPDEETKK
jgi:hypothetical protein